ncbi:MAG: threonine/serine dehydratase [Coriobacteriia bacterium]|nr:threonine/serine dehydratase [Coriobacteriia bacterium]
MDFSIDLIRQAQDRIAPHVITTPLIRAERLDSYLGCKVYLKLENMQNAGAFKLRGAMNACLILTPEQLANGIVTCSTGNHGRACSFAGKMLGVPVTVVVPHGAPDIKVRNIKALGAQVVQCPAVERFDVAGRIAAETGAAFVPPYDDWAVMAGQGTAGLEITQQLPDADVLVVPTSGGGLLSGVSCAVKESCPDVRIVGAEPAVMARYGASLEAGRPVELPQADTIADALLSNHPGEKCFEVVRRYVDQAVPVSDQAIKRAQKLLLTEGCVFAEPSACIGIGAVLDGTLKVDPDQKVCFLISGGNCAIDQLDAIKDAEV